MALASPPGVVAGDVLPMLRRFDGDVEEVLASSGHVSLYNMAVDTQQWTRKNVEGSLFLIKRRSAPRFRMMVLNKMSTENYVEDIHGGLDFELNSPYLMYTHGNSEIIGVWFYEEEDLNRVEEVLKRIKQQSVVASPASPAPRPPAPVRSAGGNGDDDGFWDKGATPASVAAAQQRLQQQQVLGGLPRPVVPVPAFGGTDASSNLANLLRNAQLKQQHQQVPDPAQAQLAGGLLPPSFFAQPQQPQQAQQQQAQQQQAQQQQALQRPFVQAPPPTPAAPQPAAASPHAKQPGAYPHAQPQSPMPQGPQAATPAGGPLAKLFANAHKAAPPPPPPQTLIPAPPPPAPAKLPAAAAPPPAPPAAFNGVSDEDRVRRLLGRISTNEALLKLLAAEMRAVGLL